MMIRLTFVLATILSFVDAAPQDSKVISQIDWTIATMDSTISNGDNIRRYVHPVPSDDASLSLRHYYTIDTTKRIFYKAVYDYVGFEQVTFYYNNQKVIKAIVRDTSSKSNPYQGDFYFANDSIISITERGVPNTQLSWNKETIISQAKQYLINFSGICNMLDKRR